MKSSQIKLPANVDDLKDILSSVEPCLQPISKLKSHVSRFVDGADMDEVFPKLWLGDCDAAMNISYLLHHHITHIVNCADNKTGPAQVKTGEEFYKDSPFIYLGINLIDLPFANVYKFFEDTAVFIDNALRSGGVVLVHCRQGRSRSASIVAAYLMLCRNYTAARALTRLKEIRDVRPNNSFLEQLAELDLQLYRDKLQIFEHNCKAIDLDEESESDSDDIDLKNDSVPTEGFESCQEYSVDACIQLSLDDLESDTEDES